MSDDIDELGPVDYIVVEFPGSKLNGEIAAALADLVDGGLTAAVLIWENTWAVPFATAVRQPCDSRATVGRATRRGPPYSDPGDHRRDRRIRSKRGELTWALHDVVYAGPP